MRKGLTGVTRGLRAYDIEIEAEVCKAVCLPPCINMQFATSFYFLHTVILCFSLVLSEMDAPSSHRADSGASV